MRLGADVGGSKIEAAVLDGEGRVTQRKRVAAPQQGYEEALRVLASLILEVESEAAARCSVGVGIPGAVSPRTGLVSNAYNTPFNGRPLGRDLESALGRPVRFANDASCFALSEAVDGAARGARVVFGATLGTGAGGGIAVEGRMLEGRHGLAGEWGHNPLPWMRPEEFPGPRCTCGRSGCLEQFVSGRALARERQALGDEAAFEIYADRLARALAHVVNLLDPDVIVLGGGASNVGRLYAEVPRLIARYAYAADFSTPLLPAAHGDASGARGAAMLWDQG